LFGNRKSRAEVGRGTPRRPNIFVWSSLTRLRSQRKKSEGLWIDAGKTTFMDPSMPTGLGFELRILTTLKNIYLE
jgi:hypothetical protein